MKIFQSKWNHNDSLGGPMLLAQRVAVGRCGSLWVAVDRCGLAVPGGLDFDFL